MATLCTIDQLSRVVDATWSSAQPGRWIIFPPIESCCCSTNTAIKLHPCYQQLHELQGDKAYGRALLHWLTHQCLRGGEGGGAMHMFMFSQFASSPCRRKKKERNLEFFLIRTWKMPRIPFIFKYFFLMCERGKCVPEWNTLYWKHKIIEKMYYLCFCSTKAVGI